MTVHQKLAKIFATFHATTKDRTLEEWEAKSWAKQAFEAVMGEEDEETTKLDKWGELDTRRNVL